jgi:spore maturation protein CgeB
MLLTDWKENLEDLFCVGKEVIAFRTPEECEELLRYYCTHDAEREAVASAGQQRTLREHTYYDRMNDLTRVLVRHLR